MFKSFPQNCFFPQHQQRICKKKKVIPLGFDVVVMFECTTSTLNSKRAQPQKTAGYDSIGLLVFQHPLVFLLETLLKCVSVNYECHKGQRTPQIKH